MANSIEYYEVTYFKRGVHQKKYDEFDEAVKDFKQIPPDYSPIMKKKFKHIILKNYGQG